MTDCVFCRISKKELPSQILYENDAFFSMPDINQKVAGHSLVIPKEHIKTFLDLPESLGSSFIDCVQKTVSRLMKQHRSTGFNLVNNNFASAGQVVEHVHFHILPRKEGDPIPWVY